MSITLAAQDLCLTQSAVSRQVHALEEQLGVQLLVRGHRSIALTPEGERLFRIGDSLIRQLQDVLGEIRAAGELRPVTVSASIGVTGLWLLPRLSRFQQHHPGVDLRVSANNRIADLRNESIDLAIRYADAQAVPDGAERLFGEVLAPVAHPSLKLTALRSARALSKLNLLEFDGTQHPWLRWDDWLASAGWTGARPKAILHFNQYDQVIQAALAGQGVALGRLALIQPLLEQGKLLRLAPARPAAASGHAYWLIQAETHPRPEVRRVAQWIMAEAQGSQLP